jgi:SAM-dependent methyltransferase
MRRVLRRFDAVVLPVRLVREVANTWNAVKRTRQREREQALLFRGRERRVAEYLQENGSRKLQIGTGTNPLPGWLNTDYEPVSSDVVFLDAVDTFPFNERVFDYVYSEHMIEHVPYKGGMNMVSEAFRVLRPGGRIRIATPDATRIAGLLSGNLDDADKAYIRWSADHLGLYSDELSPIQQRRPEWAIDPGHIRRFFADTNQDCACFIVNNFFRSYGHQFLYDEHTLTAILREAGFDDVQRFRPGQSSDAALANVEFHGQLIGDTANLFETMVLEAVKP